MHFLQKTSLLLISLVIVCGMTEWLFEKYVLFANEASFTGKMHRFLYETHPEEIPIFGSSIANNTLIPDSISPNCFNYGMNGTEADVHLMLLEKELQKDKKGPMILHLSYKGMESYIGDVGIFIPFVQDTAIRSLLQSDSLYQFRYQIPAIRYYGWWFHYLKDVLKKDHGYSLRSKGANLLMVKTDNDDFQRQIKETLSEPSSFKQNPQLNRKLHRILQTYSNRKIVFVIAPHHASVYSNYQHINKQQAFLDTLAHYPQVKVFDFSHENYADSLFHDITHLNYIGAKRFSAELRDSLYKNKVLE